MNKYPASAILSILDMVDVHLQIDNAHHELVFWHDPQHDVWFFPTHAADFLEQYLLIEKPLWYIVKQFYHGQPFEFPLTIDDEMDY